MNMNIGSTLEDIDVISNISMETLFIYAQY